MKLIVKNERDTQNRIIALFQNELGYRYLGNFEDRENTGNVIPELLIEFLRKKKCPQNFIDKALFEFKKSTDASGRSLYDVNKEVYSLLRYGVNIRPEMGENKETVYLVDWEYPLENDFYVAEEVTVAGTHSKRPDIVIYVNGIALGVFELKRSSVSVTEGIRQNIDNQKDIFIKHFFSAMQFLFAGNDSQGLFFGTVETKEKHYLNWREINAKDNEGDTFLLDIAKPVMDIAGRCGYKLDKDIISLCSKERFLELIHDFIVFDRGIKKLARHNQYFGVKCARDYIRKREGGIVWHTQGSGKSLTMVWLTKWIREHIPDARVLIITDREELDEQIEKVFLGVQEKIYRTTSGKDLLSKLDDSTPWLLCSLIHKFGRKQKSETAAYDDYLEELRKNIPTDFRAKGDIIVFVDECHRTQSGKLHKAMKFILPNALILGFTGTPLLRRDKQTSMEIFGGFIHRYTYDKAVADKVVLDLKYDARDVDQEIVAKDKIDQFFDAKTAGLSKYAKARLKERWGTLKKVFSSKGRLEKIVTDIIFDMSINSQLKNGRGNALLISDSIYNACRYYDLFQRAGFPKCAIITSFVPSYVDIKGEDAGEGDTEKILQYDIYKNMLGSYFKEDPEKAVKKVELFETEVKNKFVNEPAQMKLLIVVDKLLTGFDAPPATFLYIDKTMRDHGLFQAICRVNRVYDDEKEYGRIIDYKNLFDSLKTSIENYTNGAFDQFDPKDVEGLLKSRVISGKIRLEEALESIKALCEPVEPPRDQAQYIKYFCGDSSKDPKALENTEPLRKMLYALTSALVHAYANMADVMIEAGYTVQQIREFIEIVTYYDELRKTIMLASGEYIDLKQYEPDMRYLIDTYIGAKDSRQISDLDDQSLIDLLVNIGVDAVDQLPENIRNQKEAVAETIENNMRKVIIEKESTNPAYYQSMSVLLDSLVKLRKQEAISYEQYLNDIVAAAHKLKAPETGESYPSSVNTKAKRAFYDNLNQNEALSNDLHDTIMHSKKDQFRGTAMKRKELELVVRERLEHYGVKDEATKKAVWDIVWKQDEY